MASVAIKNVPFYEDQVRSWKEPDGRIYVILRDPCLALAIDPWDQIEKLRQDPLFEGFLCRSVVPFTMPNGGQRFDEMEGLDIEMVPMWLARINANLVSERARPKLIRYQRECAKVLREYWKTRQMIDVFVLPDPQHYGAQYSLAFQQSICRLYGQPIPETSFPMPCVVTTLTSLMR